MRTKINLMGSSTWTKIENNDLFLEKWWVKSEETVYGPYTNAELEDGVRTGVVKKDTPIAPVESMEEGNAVPAPESLHWINASETFAFPDDGYYHYYQLKITN